MSFQPPASVHTLFIDHRKTLVRTLLRLVGCRQTAEDLAQEAFVRLLGSEKMSELRHPAPFLFQIARNLAVDHLRRQQIHARNNAELDTPGILEEIPATAAEPDQEILAMQQTGQILTILRTMPLRRQKIFIMHRIYGYTYEEIAARLGVSRSSVEKHLSRAMITILDAGKGGDGCWYRYDDEQS